MSDWYSTTLGDLCVFRAGAAFPQNEQGKQAGETPFIKVSDLSNAGNESSIVSANNWIDDEQIARMRVRPVPAGASVFAKIGEGLRSERVRRLTMPTAIDNNLMAAIPRVEAVSGHFLYYLMQTVRLASHAVGSALPYLKQSTLQNVEVAVPPLSEQQAIAEVLGALDDKIAANTKLASTADEMLRAEIDARWLQNGEPSVPITDFVEVNPPANRATEASPPYIDMKRLPELGWTIDGFGRREAKGGARFANGDTLLARITPCLENGKTGYVDILPHGSVGIGSTEFIVMRARPGLASPLSFLLAKETRFRDYAIQNMVGTSGRQRVAASDLARFEVPAPDERWLADFGRRVADTFAAIRSAMAENRTLAATRDALLPQIMSGKLRVSSCVPETRS